MSAFNHAEYESILDDIETYLGYLKGNELAWKYLLDVKSELDAQGANFNQLQDFTTPGPYGYRPRYYVPVRDGEVEAIDLDVQEKILAGARESWHNGPKWAAGVAEQARSITRQVTSADVPAMSAAVESLWTEVYDGLAAVANDDWAVLGALPEQWTGRAADEFASLQNDFGDLLEQYCGFTAFAAIQIGAGTRVIDAAQQALQLTVREVRDNLKKQLDAWHRLNGPWVGQIPFLGKFLDLLSLIPTFKAVKLAFTVVRGGMKAGEQLSELGRDAKDELSGSAREAVQNRVEEILVGNADHLAGEFLTTFLEALRKVYVQDYATVMRDLAVGAVSSADLRDQLESLKDSRRWLPAEVPEDAGLTGAGDRYPGS